MPIDAPWLDTHRRVDRVTRLAAALLAVLLVAALVWYLQAANQHLEGGAVATAPFPVAAPFTLTDQEGQSLALDAFVGKPVALTFIYTHCSDLCPLIASNMHQAYLQLGSDASRVALLAVTVDPENDDVQQIRTYTDQAGLTGEWHFLTGSRDQLSAVWKSYGIHAQPADARGNPITPVTIGSAVSIASPDVIEHSAPVFLLDQTEHIRVLLPTDFATDMLVTDLRVLLSGR